MPFTRALSLADAIREMTGRDAVVPRRGETVDL
jgi:hypothetical protein